MGIPTAAFRPICGIIDKLMAVYCSWEERFMCKSPKRKATTEVSTQCNTTELYKSHLKNYELSLLGVKPHVHLFLWGQLVDWLSSPNKAHGKTLGWPWSPSGTEQKKKKRH